MKLIFKGLPGLMALLLFMPGVFTNAPAADTTNQPTAVELQRLQGAWEGVLLGQESAGKVTITITTNSLRFQGRDKNDWYVASFTLLTETNPQQLRTIITGSHETNHIGSVVRAIFKIEDETLTLAGIQDKDQEPPQSFSETKPAIEIPEGNFNLAGSALGSPAAAKAFNDDSVFRYKLRKLPPQKTNPAVPTSTK